MNANPSLLPEIATARLRLLSPRTASVLGLAALLLVAAGVPLSIVGHDLSQGLVVLPFGIVGFVVARRQSRNPIGWILLALTLAFLLSADGGSYALLYYHQGYRGLPLARVGAFLAAWWIWLLLLLPLPIALFPDGRLSRRWRRVVWVYLAVCAIFVAVSTWRDAAGIVARHIQVDSTGALVSTDGGSGSSAVKVVGALFFVGFCVASVARQIVGYRRSAGEYRQQLKWLLSGGAISIAGLLLAMGINNSNVPILQVLGFVGFLSVAALPVGDRRRDSEVPPLRDRPVDQPHAFVCDLDGAAGGDVRGHRRARHRCAAVLLAGRRCRLDAGRGGPVQPVTAAGAAARRPALQSRALRRRGDRRSLHGTAARRCRPRHDPRRAPTRRRPGRRARAHVALDQADGIY